MSNIFKWYVYSGKPKTKETHFIYLQIEAFCFSNREYTYTFCFR